MSHVTNVLLSVESSDVGGAKALDQWLREEAPRSWSTPHGGVGGLLCISDADNGWGGWKGPECEVWAGALNNADLDAVVAKVATIAWEVPWAVQLLLMDQDQFFFRLWMLRDGEMKQFAPTADEDELSASLDAPPAGTAPAPD